MLYTTSYQFEEEYKKMKQTVLKATPKETDHLIAKYIDNLNSYILMTGTHSALKSIKELESHLNFGIWYLDHSQNKPNIYRVIHCLENTPILLHHYLPSNNNVKHLNTKEIYLSNQHRLHQCLLQFSINLLSTLKHPRIIQSQCFLAFEIIQDLQLEYIVEDIEDLFIPVLLKLDDNLLSPLIIIIDHYYISKQKIVPKKLLKILEEKLNHTEEGMLALDILVFFQNIKLNTKDTSIQIMQQWQKSDARRSNFVWNSSDFDEGYDDLPWEKENTINEESHKFLSQLLEKHSIVSITHVMLSILYKKSWITKERLKDISERNNLSLLPIINAIEKDKSCVSKITSYISSKEPYKAVAIISEFLLLQDIITEEEMHQINQK